MKLSVDRLFGREIEVIEVDQRVRLGGDLATRYPDGVHLTASVRRIQHGVYMEGQVEGREIETCARCLEPFVRQSRVDVAEAYSEDVNPKDAPFSDVAPLVDRTIDVDDLLTQVLEVDEPIAAVCTEECRGICPHCGRNRNREQCDCREEQVDERFAGLAKLMQEPGAN